MHLICVYLVYCRHTGVRRPSPVVCKTVFSEPVKQINAKFGGKVPIHLISRPIVLFFEILQF